MSALHESFVERETIEASSPRSFGVIVGCAALLLWAFLWWRNGSSVWPGAIGLLLLLLAWLKPAWLHWPNRAWFHFGNLMNWITTPFVIGGVFFLVLTPIALVRRALGADDLKLKWDETASSYWEPRDPPGPEPQHLERQF
jgi:hypothetical protein